MIFFEKHGVNEKDSFHYFTLSNFQFPLHFHRAYELILVSEGQLTITIDQQEFIMKKQDMAVIFSNQIHGLRTDSSSEVTIILFSPELIGDFFMTYQDYIPVHNVIHLNHEIPLEQFITVYHQKSFLYGVCAKLVSETDFVEVKPSTHMKLLDQLFLFVEKHYSEECTLKRATNEMGYDYSYISRIFKRFMNMDFTEYLNQYRISQACYWIRNQQQPIGEVAVSCGYQNLRTFHRNFKKIMGMSPMEYRKSE